jgi:nucleoside-diphosphate-sugar epimerase
MVILVTGATGRIGRHLVNALSRGQEKVRVLVRGKMTEFENVEVSYGDITDKESVKKALDGVDTVFHLAAVVDYSAPQDVMYDVNVTGTKNILEFFRGKKFIYLSTMGVLGNKLNMPADENTPYNPSNFYTKTKMEAEKLVKASNGIIVRAPDVLMPRFTEGYDMVFSKLLEGEMKIIGDGKNIIDFIHVRDLTDALILAMVNGKSGEVYNVCGKGFKTQNESLEIAVKYLNAEMPKNHVTVISAKFASLGSAFKSKLRPSKKNFIPEYVDKIVRNRTYDISKAKRELGFEPKIDMETSIKEMVEDFLKRVEEQQKEVPKEQSEQQG